MPRDRRAEHQWRKGRQQRIGQIVHIQRHGNHAFEHIARQRQHPAPESTVHKRIRRTGVFVLRSRRNFFMEHARKDLRIQHAAGKIPKQQIKQVTHLIHRSFRLSLLPVSLPLLTAAEIADALD